MELRKNPKQIIIRDAGPIRNHKKRHERKKYKIWNNKRLEKQAAIEANMISLLTIAKINNPDLHLNFWRENLRSDYPVIEIRKSNFVNGGLGVFVTNNCVFLPSGLMYIPNCIEEVQHEPAEEGTTMFMYQFSISTRSGPAYLFPTLEPNDKLPCAQFINTPRRKTQGFYSEGVDPNCAQAMHLGNVRLLGKFPGGFRGHKVIYPGFEILGPYMSSYRLPTAEDYWENRNIYEERWEVDTKNAITRQRAWLEEIQKRDGEKIDYWRGVALEIYPRLLEKDPMFTFGSSDEVDDTEDDDFRLFWDRITQSSIV